MHLLVTGGAGYVGSHAARLLTRAGHDVTVLDNLSTGHAWAAGESRLIVGDLLDAPCLDAALTERPVDAVMHFAGSAYVGESMRDPGRYFRNNVCASLNLLEAMVAHGIASLVFSSSCTVYGIPEEVPVSERHQTHPISPYGESKLFVERMLRWFGDAHGLRSVALRYFNASGADRSGEIGEMHEPETHLIPVAIEAALGRRPCLSVNGTDYDTEDGTCVRDYVHVEDLARAHLLAVEHLASGGRSCALNLGSGEGSSVRQVIAEVERAGGRQVPHVIGPRRPGDPARLVADASRAREVLGWQPLASSLAEVVESAWRWHSDGLTRVPDWTGGRR